jgi:hypothetical protein
VVHRTARRSLVDQGKNPHLHTKNFIERLAGENMYTNGILSGISVSLARRFGFLEEEELMRNSLLFPAASSVTPFAHRTIATSSVPNLAKPSPTWQRTSNS